MGAVFMTDEYFVIVDSAIRSVNIEGMEGRVLYEFDAQLHLKNNSKQDKFKNVIINIYGRPNENIFKKIMPELECVLYLREETPNTFILEGARYYINKVSKTFHSFDDDKEIQKDIIFSKNNLK
jgi:hypothetical protein